jgi:Na+/proline symporter
LALSIVVSFIIGVATIFLVKDDATNFFLAGKSLPLWIVAFTLGAQSIDSNAILGNVTGSYRFHFFDGFVLPAGLGLSLILNGILLAPHLNKEENVLTLPDVLAKRYGKVPEVLCSICSIISFMMLLAGNLVGMGTVIGYVYGISTAAGIWTAGAIIWAYTVSGGLFSTAYTDVVQGIIGWSGCAVLAYYLIATEEVRAPPPSIGFPGYIYPDAVGDGGICDSYQGIACTNDPSLCCYNSELWCPTDDNCRTDNGAYPIGDQKIFGDQMVNSLALSPL